MNKIIIIAVVIVIVVVLVAYSDYITWFFRLLRGEIKHTKKINSLMNENKKSRYLKSKEIKNIISDVDKKIHELNYIAPKEYILSIDLERKLRYSRYDDKSITELYKSICDYMGVDYNKIAFSIRRTSSRTQTPIAGSYDEKRVAITLEISTYSTTDQLISTLSHELSHYILLSNGFMLKDRSSNEIFTDLLRYIWDFINIFTEHTRIEVE